MADSDSDSVDDPQSQHEDEEDEDPDLDVFDQVRATIQLDSLPALASRLRSKEQAESSYNCRVLHKPTFGSHHILFQVEFSDGLRWLLKVPADGYPGAFEDSSARALRSEALTMRYIKRRTTIPVPEVYHFEYSCDNGLCCPFILMEYIDGLPLQRVWYNHSTSARILHEYRSRALRGIAEAMVQLNNFKYPYGGAVTFDDKGNPSDIGPFRRMDLAGIVHRVFHTDDDDDSNIYTTVGPFADVKSFFTGMLDKREVPKGDYYRGAYKLLKYFIDLAFAKDGIQQGPQFVLSHPDFNLQNTMVSEDGNLVGIIDWDGVVAVPSCLGNSRYPIWLTRDWDRLDYRYVEKSVPGRPGCQNNREGSPSELRHYRE
ncbi:hypothetical protein FQN49_003338, partial [Arthroderma sp. PD_2]